MPSSAGSDSLGGAASVIGRFESCPPRVGVAGGSGCVCWPCSEAVCADSALVVVCADEVAGRGVEGDESTTASLSRSGRRGLVRDGVVAAWFGAGAACSGAAREISERRRACRRTGLMINSETNEDIETEAG